MNDPAVLATFARQHGVASEPQLLEFGHSAADIRRARQRGALVRVLGQVYRIAGQAMTFRTRAMAAQLHFGARGYLTGVTAGVFHGVRNMPCAYVRMAVTGPVGSVPRWLWASNTATIDGGDVVTVRGGFRVAEPRRMLLALADELEPDWFEKAAEDVWHLGLVTPAAAAEYVESIRGRRWRGVRNLQRWIDDASGRDAPCRSGLEFDTLRAIRWAGAPEPVRQYPVVLSDGSTVHLDLAWPDVRLAVEPGHSWWHGGNDRMSADYTRDRLCAEIGWHVLRFDESIRDDLLGAGEQIARIHRARASLFAAPVLAA